MTTVQFCHWLKEAVELTNMYNPTPEQQEMIKRHLGITIRELNTRMGVFCEWLCRSLHSGKPIYWRHVWVNLNAMFDPSTQLSGNSTSVRYLAC